MNEIIHTIVNCQRVKDISKLKHEVFVVLYLCDDGTYKGNADYDCVGTKDCVPFPHPNTVIQNCQKLKSKCVVFVHNHPAYRGLETFFLSECYVEPSILDISSTRLFTKALQQHNISVLDHIIVSPNDTYFSFAENCLM